MRPVFAFLALLLSGCQTKADADAVAASCGGSCPPGTWRDEQRGSRSSSTDYADFVEGECAWSCVAVASCPEETVPVITEECFTCARSMPDGSLAGGACDDSTWVSGRDDSPDGNQPVAEVGGTVPEDDNAPRFRSAQVEAAWSLSIEPKAAAASSAGVWVADWRTESVFLLSHSDGSAIDRIDLPGLRPRELAVSGDHLWVMDDVIEVWSISSRSVQTSVDTLSYAGITGLGDEILQVVDTTMVRHIPESGTSVGNSALQEVADAPVAAAWDRLLSVEQEGGEAGETWTILVHDLSQPSPHPTEEPMRLSIGPGTPTALAVHNRTLYVAGDDDESTLYKISFD